MPDYWRVLTEPVPPEKGLPHLRNVRISDIKAAARSQAFSVASYKDSPLREFRVPESGDRCEDGRQPSSTPTTGHSSTRTSRLPTAAW